MSRRRYSAKEVADAIRASEGVITVAAARLKCERATVYAYVDEFPTVAQALKEARRGLVGEAQGYLVATLHATQDARIAAAVAEAEAALSAEHAQQIARATAEVRELRFRLQEAMQAAWRAQGA